MEQTLRIDANGHVMEYQVMPDLRQSEYSLGEPGLVLQRCYNRSPDPKHPFCGAGHEMVVVDVYGKTYPCHRFLPWVTGRPAPNKPVNRQTIWKPEKCANCKLIPSCPTCVGFNWEVNNDTGMRTTYHCESNKLEVLASAKLIALKLKNHQIPELDSMSLEKRKKLKKRINVLWELIENGI